MNFYLFIALFIVIFVINSALQSYFRNLLNVTIEGKFWDCVVYGSTVTVFDIVFLFLIFTAIYGEFE